MKNTVWEKWGNYAVKTDGYVISKASVNGKWIYVLWSSETLPHKFLSKHESFKEAKNAIRCE